MSRRPLGMTLLAGFYLFIAGVLGLALVVTLSALATGPSGPLGGILRPLERRQFPPGLLAIMLVIATPMMLAPGIGLWRGRPWGWWVTAVIFLNSVLRNGTRLLLAVSSQPDPMTDGLQGGLSPEVKFTARIAIAGFILAYMFTDRVLDHYQIHGRRAWRNLSRLIGATLALFLLGQAIAML